MRGGRRSPASGRGTGASSGHHGELLQGRFRCTEIGECPGLVTVPVQALASVAVFVPDRSGAVRARAGDGGSGAVHKARIAARATIDHLGDRWNIGFTGGELELTRAVPVGMGLGSSTADVLATVRAVADSASVDLDTGTVAQLAVAAEGASDPLWVDGPVLFAHRHGHVIEDLGAVLPPMTLLRCLLGGPVDTLALPPSGTADVEQYEELRYRLREAVRVGDTAGIAAVATRSAQLNQSRHFKPELDLLIEVSKRCGALGVQISHSGNVAGLLFDGAPCLAHGDDLAAPVARGYACARAVGLRVIRMPVSIGAAA